MPLPVKSIKALGGWGRHPVAPAQCVRPERARDFVPQHGAQIPRGQGRSYGDAALCTDGVTILTERMNRLLAFDAHTGVLRAESGTTLAEVLEHFVPQGWFVPVTPGTKFCSLGGCLASDVHGKNHHHDGSFSQHVPRAVILDSEGHELDINPESHPDLFWATAGGMGLTGLVTELELRLRPIETSFIKVKHTKGASLSESLDLLSDPRHDDHYTVAWIDCLAGGGRMGRSILMAGHHLPAAELPAEKQGEKLRPHGRGKRSVPIDFPSWFLNGLTVRAFNGLYGALQGSKTEFVTHYDQFFYPLDGVLNWNRIYGKKGFIQYQMVFPEETANVGLTRLLQGCAKGGFGSFLAVLKKFGPAAPGMLSFPSAGYTLALDFPMKKGLLEFLAEMDRMILDLGGRQYLAKDSRMSSEGLDKMYPRLHDFRRVCRQQDPEGVFRSDLARRLEVLG